MKRISIKVFNPAREFLKEWTNASFDSFSMEINGGLSECVISLGEKFDYQGSELLEGNEVDILISDAQAKELLIYSGYISRYVPFLSEGREGITINLLGHHTKMGIDILKEGTQTSLYTKATVGLTTVSGDEGPAEVADILRSIIGRYIAENPGCGINYSGETIFDTGNDGEYYFEQKTYREAIDKIKDMAPAGWFWYIGEDRIVYFKSKPTTPTHTFVFGKHFSGIRVEKSMENIRNVLLFWNGETGGSEIYKSYEDQASINQYGRRVEKYSDWLIGDETTADNIAARFLSECKDPSIKVICDIFDNNEDAINGYDIESIKPGDTCNFKGFNDQYADLFQENMLISKVVYSLGKVELTIEVQKKGIVEWQDETAKKTDSLMAKSLPEIYSV